MTMWNEGSARLGGPPAPSRAPYWVAMVMVVMTTMICALSLPLAVNAFCYAALPIFPDRGSHTVDLAMGRSGVVVARQV